MRRKLEKVAPPGEVGRCLLSSAPAVGGEVLRSRHEFALSVATRQRPRLTPQFPHRSEEFRFGPPLRGCGADGVNARWVIVSGQPALPAISQRILRLLPVEAARQLLEQLAFRNAALRRKYAAMSLWQSWISFLIFSALISMNTPSL